MFEYAFGTGCILGQYSPLEPATTYYLKVRAKNLNYEYSEFDTTVSTATLPADAPPAPPSGLAVAVKVSTTQITLTWTDNADNEIGFRIERTVIDGEYTEIGSVDADVTTYTDTELEIDTTYYYRVLAYNEIGDSEYSNAIAAEAGKINES